ncbi:signal transducer and activator of transcription 1a isoform X1 [Lates japonicus]|uniref:Signal transducer and activator of transcription 1a isoform X1 n=1 Tax=Lates japonicus TaxID=270547 RepID=A0AAD3RCW4_LATJO|nr:signal transducer and activator of transcription 1a isoform X1 [Lates japonicus]
MKIQLACLLLVLLSATELCKALDFYQKHVVYRMDPEECDDKMERINKNTGGQKPINTFLLITRDEADKICANNVDKLQSLQQVRQHLKKLEELEQKFTYDSDSITQKKAFLEARALELLNNLFSKFLVKLQESRACLTSEPFPQGCYREERVVLVWECCFTSTLLPVSGAWVSGRGKGRS